MRARAKDEVACVVGVVGEAAKTAGGKHLGVGKGRVGVAGAGFGGIVVGKGGRKKVVAVHDAVAEVMKGKGGRGRGGEAICERRSAAGECRGVEAGISRKPILWAPCGLADGGHATYER